MHPDVLYDTVINIKKNVTSEEESVVYFALSGPLVKQFDLFGNMSSLTYTKQIFFPHVSMESLSYYFKSIKYLFNDKNDKTYFSSKEFHDLFSLVLYKITTKTVI